MLLLHCASEFLQVTDSSPVPCPIQSCHIAIVEYDFEILTTLVTGKGAGIVQSLINTIFGSRSHLVISVFATSSNNLHPRYTRDFTSLYLRRV